MLLTRKSAAVSSTAPRMRRLHAPAATFDRRTFLKRSGMVAGAGAFATQLPLGSIRTAEAADESSVIKREVHRTVCTHCSVGCAIDAVVDTIVGMLDR